VTGITSVRPVGPEGFLKSLPERSDITASPVLVVSAGPRPAGLVRVGISVLPLVVALALAPLGFLAAVSWACDGRNLTALFYAGSVLFLAAGVVVSGFGQWRRRTAWMVGGTATFASALVCIALVWECPTIAWVGIHRADLTIRVCDAATGRPISGATVRLFDPQNPAKQSRGRTGPDGTVRLSYDFFAYGTSSTVRRTGSMRLAWNTLEVEVAGYELLSEELATYTESRWNLYGPPLPEVEIRLNRKAPGPGEKGG
jgi:hypothetical protein